MTATPVLSAEEMKKRELASALFGGKGGINREGMLSVSTHIESITCPLISHCGVTGTNNRTVTQGIDFCVRIIRVCVCEEFLL